MLAMRYLFTIIILFSFSPCYCQQTTITRKTNLITMVRKKPTTKFTSNVNLREAVFSVVAENENGVPFSHGTGFFLSSSGVGVTNFHVLQGAVKGYVQTSKGEQFEISQVLDYNPNLDLVKFKVNVKNKVRPLKLAVKNIEQGSAVFSFGTPKQYRTNNTVQTGLFLQRIKLQGYGDVLQTTLPIEKYSSGLPVVIGTGEVVGLLTDKINGSLNVSYAISVSNIKALSRSLDLPISEMVTNPMETADVKKAYSYGEGGEYYKAVKMLSNVLSVNPTNHLALYYRGVFQCRGKLDVEAGLADLANACKMVNYGNYEYNMHYSAFLRNQFLINTDMNVEDRSVLEQIVFVLKKCIEIDSNRNGAYAQLAYILSVYYKNVPERLKEALDYSNHAIELDGTDPVSYIERAEIKRHLHDVGGAVLDCESAIELAPNYYRAYFIRGDIKFFDLRSFNEGLMDINKALSLVPQNRNNEKADILGLRGMAKASKALVERPYDLKLVLADAVKDLDEAYSLYPRPLFIERKNEILSELNK